MFHSDSGMHQCTFCPLLEFLWVKCSIVGQPAILKYMHACMQATTAGFHTGGGGALGFPPPREFPPKFKNYYVIIAYTWSKTAVEGQYTFTVAHLRLHVGLLLTTTEYDDCSLRICPRFLWKIVLDPQSQFA